MSLPTPEVNPYAPPETPGVAVESATGYPGNRVKIAWIWAVGINLPIPLWLGFGCTEGGGQVGMLFGILAVTGSGLLLCGRTPQAMSDLCKGAMLTALSQFFPILQMYVGIAAVMICTSGTENGELSGVGEITMATVLTGIGLIIPSLVVGLLIGSLSRSFRK